jgi:hypothetical protein
LQQVTQEQLQVNMTALIAVSVPPNANAQQLQNAYAAAHLSQDEAISDLSWAHTRAALGSDVQTVLEGQSTQRLSPYARTCVIWPTIFFPVLAGAIIIGSLLLLRVKCLPRPGVMRAEQELADLRVQLQVPSELLRGSLSLINAAMLPLMNGLRRSSYFSSTGSAECVDDVEVGARAGDARERKRRLTDEEQTG